MGRRVEKIVSHQPVLLKEVIACLEVRPGKKYLDATVGFAGHSLGIVEKGGRVLGLDRDPITIAKLKRQILRRELKTDKLKIVCGNFADLGRIAKKQGFSEVNGVLFDLGLSSWQLEKSGRGFSFKRDEPLDMRVNRRRQRLTAAEVVNRTKVERLREIFEKYGEEKRAQEIAKAIVRQRPFKTSGELVEAIKKTCPASAQRGRLKKTLARIFQALRIVVNDELSNLEQGLKQATELLKPQGRLVVISYHSLEDRLVKFKIPKSKYKIITPKPWRPSSEEIKRNPRARSAKLRVAEKRD